MCEIISTLTREQLQVNQLPRSRTGALFNIKKALERLSSLKLPIEVLRKQDELYEGRKDVILELLWEMKKKFNAQTDIILKTSKNYEKGLAERKLKTKGKTRLNVVTSNLKDNSHAALSSLTSDQRKYLLATTEQFWK